MGDTLTTLDIFRNPVYNNGDADHDFLTMLPELRKCIMLYENVHSYEYVSNKNFLIMTTEFLMLQETNFRYPGIPSQYGSLSNLGMSLVVE